MNRRLKNRWHTSDRNCVELFYNLSECRVATFLLEGMLHSSMQALQMLLFIRQLSSFLVGASRFPCMMINTCKQELCKTVKKEIKILFVLAIVRAAAICTNTVSTIIHRQILQTARLEKHRQRVKIITSYSFKIRE